MDEHQIPSAQRLRDLVAHVQLVNTPIDKIERMRRLHSQVQKGQGGHLELLKVLVSILRENQQPLADVCKKCTELSQLKKMLLNGKQDLHTLQRSSALKKNFETGIFADLSVEDRRLATNTWIMHEAVPDRPEFNYYVYLRMMYVKFQPDEIDEPQVVWDDNKGKFVKIDRRFRQSVLTESDRQFRYNTSTVGFIYSRTMSFLEKYDEAQNQEDLIQSLDKAFIMLFSYFNLLGCDISLQDIVNSNEKQLTNFYCALMLDPELRDMARDEDDIVETVKEYLDLHWTDKWQNLAWLILISTSSESCLHHVLNLTG